MLDVLDRMVQLRYASRLKLDKHFFDKVDGFVDLFAKIEGVVPPDSGISNASLYKKMLGYRKTNHFQRGDLHHSGHLTAGADFSRSSVEARIGAGYSDAIPQGIAAVDSPELRFGVTK